MARGKHLVGIDIGSTSVKVVEFKRKSSGLEVQSIGYSELPRDTIAEGTIINRAAVAETIRSIFTKNKIKNRYVALAVYGHNVIIKKLNVPAQSAEDLEEFIVWEAEETIPFDTREVYLATHIINPKGTIHGRMNVLLVAAKRDTVNDYSSLVRECGLIPSVVDVVPFSLSNILEQNYGVLMEESVALINIGDSFTTVNVVTEGVPVHSQHLQVGGRKFLDDLQKKVNISSSQAHSLIIGDHEEFPQHILEEVPNIIRTCGQEIIREIVRPLNFYVQNSLNINIKKAYIAGGVVLNNIFLEVLRNNLGYEIEVLNPFKNASLNQKRVNEELLNSRSSVFGVAAGLALRQLGD